MDGENNGKPYEQIGGRFPTILGNPHGRIDLLRFPAIPIQKAPGYRGGDPWPGDALHPERLTAGTYKSPI